LAYALDQEWSVGFGPTERTTALRLSGRPCLAENHDETERHDAFRFRDRDRGCQKERIFEKAKSTLGASLSFVGRDQMLVRENGWLKDIGAHNPAGFAESFLLDPFLS